MSPRKDAPLAKAFDPRLKKTISGVELLRRFEALAEEMAETARRKNADYAGTGQNQDGFANLRMIETLSHGAISTEMGFLTRISDKYSRVMSLITSNKEPEVIEESLTDTLIDMANYCLLFAIYRGAGAK